MRAGRAADGAEGPGQGFPLPQPAQDGRWGVLGPARVPGGAASGSPAGQPAAALPRCGRPCTSGDFVSSVSVEHQCLSRMVTLRLPPIPLGSRSHTDSPACCAQAMHALPQAGLCDPIHLVYQGAAGCAGCWGVPVPRRSRSHTVSPGACCAQAMHALPPAGLGEPGSRKGRTLLSGFYGRMGGTRPSHLLLCSAAGWLDISDACACRG